MNILLFGRDNSITHTIHDMLSSGNGWETTLVFKLESVLAMDTKFIKKQPGYDILAANLGGFSTSPKEIVKKISETLPSIPLLVLYSYSQEFLIKPLIAAGAGGYLQLGSSEAKLLETIEKVAQGEEVILTEIT